MKSKRPQGSKNLSELPPLSAGRTPRVELKGNLA